MTSTALPQLGSLTDLRAFLLSRGFLDESAPFALPAEGALPAPAAQDGMKIIAVAGESVIRNVLLVIHVPLAKVNKAERQRLQRYLATVDKDALLVAADSWRELRLYWIGKDGTLLDWTLNPAALRPQDRKALEMLDIRDADLFELDALFTRMFRRSRRDSIYANQGLFSSYFLDERLKEDGSADSLQAAWDALRAALPALSAQATAILDAADGLDAAATRRQVVEPLLRALGWQSAPGEQGYDLKLQSGGQTVALCNVAPWGASLETAGDGGSAPDLRMIAALTAQGEHAAQWGVLTNGQTWRLFATFASSASGVYYEVDLADLRDLGEPDDWRLWFAFFSQDWLRDDAAHHQPGLTKRVYQEGQLSAQKLGEELKQAIFKEVFPLLATALAEAMRRRGEEVESEAATQLIFRATLILLYRLLFLLYAESRRLLPLTRNEYFGHSLSYLLIRIAAHKHGLGQRLVITPDDPWMWNHLRDLFAAIDQGRPEWGVPRYNGGLFAGAGDPARELLGRLDNVGADHLSDGLDRLARDQVARRASQGDLHQREHSALRFIDYMALDVRRLGSIYEGLLEYRLRWEERDGAPALVLENSHRERKASGSYYTPDYIVSYIVEQTVGPVLDARVPRFADALSRFRAARTAASRGRSDARFQSDQMEQAKQQAVDALLDIKVLDPAMGSGHFLVEAVDLLSDRIIEIIERPGFKDDNPILEALRATEQEIRESVAAQGVAGFVEERHLTQRNVLRRMVMKRCIYGVDLNDMAVELARLSLWLHSFTVGAPLSFLDHHLKHGNSLVGVWEIGDAIAYGSESWGNFTRALANQMTIARLTDSTAEQLDSSYALYGESERLLRPLRQSLNVNLAQHFASLGSVGRAQSIPFAKADAIIDSHDQEKFATAQRIAADKRFFHWKLEFAEVFFDAERQDWRPTEEAGFDAVVGNPPYGDIFHSNDKKFLQASYPYAKSQIDGYTVFMELQSKVISSNKFVGFIVSSSFIAMNQYHQIRRMLLEKYTLKEIILFKYPVFEDPTVEASIFIGERERYEDDYPITGKTYYQEVDFPDKSPNTKRFPRKIIEEKHKSRLSAIVSFDFSIVDLMLETQHDRLGDISNIFNGLKPYEKGKGKPPQTKEDVEQRIYDSDKRMDSTYFRYIVGGDLDRYIIDPKESWIKYGNWLAAPRSSSAFFVTQKIVIRQTDDKIIAAIDTNQYLHLNNVHNVQISHAALKTQYVIPFSLAARALFRYPVDDS